MNYSIQTYYFSGCGIENVNTRIINGRRAERFRYPWMVLILPSETNAPGYYNCGGSIINDRYILTAGHCLMGGRRPAQIRAIIGAYDRNEANLGREGYRLEVESYKVHERYSSGGPDIALIKLKYPLTFTSTFSPICLATFSNYNNLFIYGWGRQNQGSNLVNPTFLHEVEVDQVQNRTCSRFWGNRFDQQHHICAGTQTGICSGDSGSPLSTRANGRVNQVGIVSSGYSCKMGAGSSVPDLYERVSSHLAWISDNTRDAKWCSNWP